MPPANHDHTEGQFAQNVPATAEAVRSIWQANADANGAVGGDDFEDDVETEYVMGSRSIWPVSVIMMKSAARTIHHKS